jgi:hypothetical protein
MFNLNRFFKLTHFSWLSILLIMNLIPIVSAQTDCNAEKCDSNGENCQRVSLMSVEQCETLLAIYQSTNGPRWKINDGWNITNEPRDFALLETDNNGNVVELNLGENRLQGTLPNLIGFSYLEQLNLFENQLDGPLPDLTTLTNLKVLNLRNNQLSGSLPDFSQLTLLEKVSFYDNQLCGQIPDLSALTNLEQIDLINNQLTGPIPDLSQLNNLKNLGLSGNKLCRDENADYSGFEYAVNSYPLCSATDEYPSCVEYTLTINKEGTGNGNITAPGIECGNDCTETYNENAEITLIVLPDADSSFSGWRGACTGTETCQITMNQAQNVIATFDKLTETEEPGTVEQPGTTEEPGTVEQPDPTEEPGPIVDSKTYTLTVNSAGTGTGSITIDDLECGATCSGQYVENLEVILTATATADSVFIGWSGACSNTTPVCQILMNQQQTVTATFNIAPPSPPELEFIGLRATYNVREWLNLELVERLPNPPRVPMVDLWVAVEDPNNLFHYMTDSWLEPFSLAPQPFRRSILSSELENTNASYHLLSFDVPPNMGGTYNFYAIYNEAGADLSNLFKTQQSEIAFATTILSNNLNPSRLVASQAGLTLLVGEELELIVDSDTTLEAILDTCRMTPPDIVQSNAAVSSDGNGISCYLKALKPGSATLTTTDKVGKTLQTLIIVK